MRGTPPSPGSRKLANYGSPSSDEVYRLLTLVLGALRLLRSTACDKRFVMISIDIHDVHIVHQPRAGEVYPEPEAGTVVKPRRKAKRSRHATPSLGHRIKSLFVAALLAPHAQAFGVTGRRLAADAPMSSETQILGSLSATDAETAHAAKRALAYLGGHDEFDAMLDELVSYAEPVLIAPAANLDANTASPLSDTINWDQSSKLAAANQTNMQGHVICSESSAAMNLGHELRHAHWHVHNPLGQQLLLGLMHPSFDNFEERRVVLLTNNHSEVLGEGTRINHAGDFLPATTVDDHGSGGCDGYALPLENRRIGALLNAASGFDAFQAAPSQTRTTLATELGADPPSETWLAIEAVIHENDDAIASLRNATTYGPLLLNFEKTYVDHIERANTLAESLQYL